MMEGISVEVEAGFAYIEFMDKRAAGPVLQALIDVGGQEMIDVNTGGTRRTYIVPESIAIAAGVLDATEPVPPVKPRKARTARAKPTE